VLSVIAALGRKPDVAVIVPDIVSSMEARVTIGSVVKYMAEGLLLECFVKIKS
jgi:hypothetical protein